MYWAVRLTGNWVYAFPGLHHEDWRYPLLRDGAGRWEFLADLFGIHLVPTVQVFLGMLPVYVAVTTPGDGLVWLSWVALVIGIAAVTLELVADTQMHRFVAAKQPGAVMDQGLWAWSRHPNYLGRDRLLVRRWHCSGWPPPRVTGGGCSSASPRWSRCSSARASR